MLIPAPFRSYAVLVSLAVCGIALACDLKWREYPQWAYYSSLLLVGFFWYLFIRGQGWLLSPQANWLNLVKVIGGLVVIGFLSYVIGLSLCGSRFGGGDAKFMVVLSLLVPTTHVWIGSPTTFPTTHNYLPVDFWANMILFWIPVVIAVLIIERLVEFSTFTVPLTPLIVASFYLTIYYGGIWRGITDPLIPIILGR